ncbi:DUF418 domain-containing protein [Salinicoccus halodurans]|uniref:DUF418 domain-containing protein n=1 Tax=Salinicoccus halodurans TaxID=407035 RepID=UPI001F197203|nr:DUF418 domain-containing protein [Salinicoccus halodurans]
MERLKLKTEDSNIKFMLGITFFLVLLMNGMYYMMPFDAINIYEYLNGDELRSYHLLNIFTGSAVLPLLALLTGYMLNHYRGSGIGNIAKILVAVFAIGTLQAVFIFAYDFLPGLALMAFAGLLFLKPRWYVPMVSSIVLFGFHMAVNVLPDILENIGSPTDKIYSAIQTVNDHTSVFRSSDYFAILSKNIEIFTGDIAGGMYTLVFTVLPWILFGIALGKLDIRTLLGSNQLLTIAMFITLAGGGLALKMIQVVTLGTYSGTLLADNFGGPVLALGYFILLVYLADVSPGKLHNLFVPLGRRSLTMYIFSNVFLIFIFYGIGFTAYSDVTILTMVIIMTALYAVLLGTGFLFQKFEISGIESLFTNNSDKFGKKS